MLNRRTKMQLRKWLWYVGISGVAIYLYALMTTNPALAVLGALIAFALVL